MKYGQNVVTPVISRCIGGMMWLNGTLTIRFNNGSTYVYTGIPAAIWLFLRDASSPGRYFNRAIRCRFHGYKV